MNQIKTTVYEQLRQLQMLMHREAINHHGRMRNPHRGQGRVLAILKLKPEISQKELTYLLNMSKQSVAELIGKLDRNGYITRRPSEEDKRIMIIKLTDKGRNAVSEEEAAPESTEMLDCLNEEELEAFSEYLGRMIKQYEGQFPNEDFEGRRRMIEEFMSFHGGEHGFGHGVDRGHHHGRDRNSHDCPFDGGPFKHGKFEGEEEDE